ncbi:MAG: patatin-like phospholipase family protein [Planctomycetaceae bacterium]|nr:patatin-like phospholipase family protein [Planctomycetaceae bacterium]
MSKQSVTLALGGGGARGVAHLGVIEEVLKAGWNVERVIGISIGSLAGAMYAFDPDIKRVQQKALDYLLSPDFERQQQELFKAHRGRDTGERGGLFSWYHTVANYLDAHQTLTRAVTRKSLLPGALLEEVVKHLLPDADISEAKIPLGIAAVDLMRGERVVLEEGPLRVAVQASASIPGIFPPVKVGDKMLCDLGVVSSLPVRIARKYDPNILVGVDVGGNMRHLTDYATALDVLMRIIEIGESTFREDLRIEADLVIAPEVGDTEWFDFSESKELMEAGRRAGQAALLKMPDTQTRLERVRALQATLPPNHSVKSN